MELLLEIGSYVFWVLLAITTLVFVHELGHFLAAKLFGMRVDRFAVGFPPFIARKQVGETEYVLGATPLGGYVKIAGMIDESLDNDMSEEPAPDEFRAKPVWQRIVVITAGVIFNVILAALVYAGLTYSYGETFIPAANIESVYVADSSIAYEIGLRTGDNIVAVSGEPLEQYGDLMSMDALLADTLTITVERAGARQTFVGPPNIMTRLTRAQRAGRGFGLSAEPPLVGGLLPDGPAAEAGLQPGDRVLSVNGDTVRFFLELSDRIQAAGAGSLTIRWARPDSLIADDAEGSDGALPVPVRRRAGDAAVYQAELTPDYDAEQDRYLIGVAAAPPGGPMIQEEFGVQTRTYGPGEAVVAGAQRTWSTTTGIAESLKRVFTGRDSFTENVGGPVAIARVTKEAAERGAEYFWSIVAFLSITLAIMNILPIPALDGGHLVFLLYEAVTRREPSVRVRLALQQIGMVVLIVFMAFVIFNDILRW